MKEFDKLKTKNDKIRDKIEDIFQDCGLRDTNRALNETGTATELWKLINSLIENEIQQEELCGE